MNTENLNEDIKSIISDKSDKHPKKQHYKRISDQTRQELIEMVYLKDYLLKDAAKSLGINYSTAKTIIRIFRIEKRLEKKKSHKDKQLRKLLLQFKQENDFDCLDKHNKNLKQGKAGTDEGTYIIKALELNDLKVNNGSVEPLTVNNEQKEVKVSDSNNHERRISALESVMERQCAGLLNLSQKLDDCFSIVKANQQNIECIKRHLIDLPNGNNLEELNNINYSNSQLENLYQHQQNLLTHQLHNL